MGGPNRPPLVQKRNVINWGPKLTSFGPKKCYATKGGPQHTSFDPKNYVSNGRPQLTSFDPKNVTSLTGGPN